MYDRVKTTSLLLTLVAGLATFAVAADKPPAGISHQPVNVSALANVPGHNLTAVVVELAPGTTVPSHTHAGFVFAYVLEGTVRSQLNSAAAMEFTAGESWTEPAGTVHSLTHNPSATDRVKLLAVFVAKDGAKLTNFGADH